jgi:hypothetical protein
MAVAMIMDNPGGSQEIYERFRELIGLDRPAGGIVHIAGPSPSGGWRVIELWESEEEARRFLAERLLPAAEAIGAPAPPPPQFWPVHSHLTQETSAGPAVAGQAPSEGAAGLTG